LRRALPSVEHFVSCHPDSILHKCGRILYPPPRSKVEHEFEFHPLLQGQCSTLGIV
jgi:hypothetical protein